MDNFNNHYAYRKPKEYDPETGKKRKQLRYYENVMGQFEVDDDEKNEKD